MGHHVWLTLCLLICKAVRSNEATSDVLSLSLAEKKPDFFPQEMFSSDISSADLRPFLGRTDHAKPHLIRFDSIQKFQLPKSEKNSKKRLLCKSAVTMGRSRM